eukprot:Opistho-2@89716
MDHSLLPFEIHTQPTLMNFPVKLPNARLLGNSASAAARPNPDTAMVARFCWMAETHSSHVAGSFARMAISLPSPPITRKELSLSIWPSRPLRETALSTRGTDMISCRIASSSVIDPSPGIALERRLGSIVLRRWFAWISASQRRWWAVALKRTLRVMRFPVRFSVSTAFSCVSPSMDVPLTSRISSPHLRFVLAAAPFSNIREIRIGSLWSEPPLMLKSSPVLLFVTLTTRGPSGTSGIWYCLNFSWYRVSSTSAAVDTPFDRLTWNQSESCTSSAGIFAFYSRFPISYTERRFKCAVSSAEK